MAQKYKSRYKVTNNYQVQSVWSKRQTNMGEKLTEIKNHQKAGQCQMSEGYCLACIRTLFLYSVTSWMKR